MADKPQTLTLPVLITRGLVVFPGNQRLIEAGRSFSVSAINISKQEADSLIFVTCQISSDVNDPTEEDIYHVGTLCRIISCTEKNGNLKARVEVVDRIRLIHIKKDVDKDYFVATGEIVPSINPTSEALDAAMTTLRTAFESTPNIINNMPQTVMKAFTQGDDPVAVCYGLASFLDASVAKKQEILETDDLTVLVSLIATLVSGENQKQMIDRDIADAVRESTEKSQKEYFLREKLKAIKKELGDDVEGSNDPDKILEKLEKFPYPENIKTKVKSEIKKYEMMPSGSLEGALILSYLDVIMNIPWWQKTEDIDDLKRVEKILNEDHYGLDKAKKRIIEYLAVKKLTGNLKSPILCFYGPPGTGKTSLGKSIARALGRKFFKAALGGISDEAEIRGHRRTYVGSLPGRIIQGMRKVGVTNPVFLLDEVDKVASSYKGDPASALLEVLDPEQNIQFNDNYVEEPYDLSDVLFIATANNLENIPGPLRDRLELIPLSSYTEIEKMHIAKEHLISKQIFINGLKDTQASFTDDALTYIIREYTMEAGVRDLERKIASCLRKVAVAIVKDPTIEHIEIDVKKVKEYLGVPVFSESKKEKVAQVGVVTGLAYTDYGGDILPIEATYFKGKGMLVLTGKLGEVMRESATIAVDYVRANAERYGIDSKLFMENDIHIHVPEGAVPKDGPSAGVALTTVIVSLMTGRKVSPDIAMTGEVTLRGNALPIGGLREKSMAALRSGIKTIIVPEGNKKDAEDLPKEIKESLKIIFMKNVDDALKVALVD